MSMGTRNLLRQAVRMCPRTTAAARIELPGSAMLYVSAECCSWDLEEATLLVWKCRVLMRETKRPAHSKIILNPLYSSFSNSNRSTNRVRDKCVSSFPSASTTGRRSTMELRLCGCAVSFPLLFITTVAEAEAISRTYTFQDAGNFPSSKDVSKRNQE
eukprot:3683257-Rhodomonas_salina.1